MIHLIKYIFGESYTQQVIHMASDRPGKW